MRRKYILLIAFAFAVFLLNSELSFSWWSANYLYLKNDTVKSHSGSFNNYTYLVNGSFFNTQELVSNSKMRSDCKDLVLVNQTDAVIPFEYEAYENTTYGCNTPKTIIWARNMIASDNSTQISIYYDYSTESSFQNNTNYTFKDYKGVWHAGEGYGSHTKNSVTGVVTAATVVWSPISIIGNSIKAGNGRVNSDVSSLADDTHTMEAWVKITSAGGATLRFFGDPNSAQYHEFGLRAARNVEYGLKGTDLDSLLKLNTGEIYYIVERYNTTHMCIFINGTLDICGAMTGTVTGGTIIIGENNAAWDTTIDELRFHESALSDAQIKQNWEQMKGRLNTLGTEQEQPEVDLAPNVTMILPLNTTYLQNWLLLNFTVSDDNPTINCWRSMDGAEVSIGGVTNNSYTSFNYTGLSTGGHNITVRCQDSVPNQTSVERFASLKFYEVKHDYFQSSQYETNWTIFSMGINTSTNVNNVTANLTLNGTIYTPTRTNSTGIWNFTYNLSIPLIESNNTKWLFNWTYRINYTTDTSESNTTVTKNQTLYHSYYLLADANGDRYLEGDVYNYSVNTGSLFSWAKRWAKVNFNGTNITGERSSDTLWKSYLAMPRVSGTNETFTATRYLNIEYEGKTKNRTTAKNMYVYNMSLVPCGSPSTLEFIGYNEIGEVAQNFTMDISFTTTNGAIIKNYRFNFTDNNNNKTICISPSWALFIVDADIEYQNLPANEKRFYWLVNASVSNVSETVNLYLLNTTYAEEIVFTVKDSAASPISEMIIKAQRYYPASNSYKTVAMGKTGADGKSPIRLERYNAYYRFILEKNNLVESSFAKEILTALTRTFYTSPPSLAEYFEYWDKIAYSCSANTTGWLQCTGTDTSGKVQKYRLIVKKYGVTAWSTVCEDIVSGSAVTMSCNLGNTTGNYYYYVFQAYTNPVASWNDLIADWITGSGIAMNWGMSGLFLTLMLTMILVFAGAWNPAVAIILTAISLIAAWYMKWMVINPAFLIGAILIIIIMAIKVKS